MTPAPPEVLAWMTEAELAAVATAGYWNDEAEEAGKEYDVRDGDHGRLVRYLTETTALRRQFDELILLAGRSGRPVAGTVLDAAAGACWAASLLSRLPSVEKVYALDISKPRLLKLAPAVFEALGARPGKIVRVLGSFYDVKLPGGSLDACLLVQAFHHADDPRRLLAELHRVLKPGGTVLVMGETPVRPRDVWVKRAKNLAKAVVPRSWYAAPRAPGFFPPFSALFPPDPLLGDHYYRDGDYRRLFKERGFELRERRMGRDSLYVAVKT